MVNIYIWYTFNVLLSSHGNETDITAIFPLWIAKGKSRGINLSKMNKSAFPKLVVLKLRMEFSDQRPMFPVGTYE